jgi:hypothetical protein
MKIFIFYKTGFFTFLIFLFAAFPAFGNSFHDSLPATKREEIKIIDEYTVEIGIGHDNRSVSCNILDAVQSIPHVGLGGKPAIIFVNKEKIHLFRNKMYTWDREGNYRVRLTTKYIREFGNIRVHVPEKITLRHKELKPTELSSSYHQNLPQNIKEEITIIDENMVEVAIGPDDHSVSTTLPHAIKSIPNAKENIELDQVFVNNVPIYRIKKGLYTWDTTGRNPIRLTTNYIRKFGNIKIHIVDEAPLPTLEEKPEITLAPKAMAPPPVVKEESFTLPKPPSPPVPEKINTGVVNGFRLAKFGMSEKQVINAIFVDFDLSGNEIEKRRDPKSGQRILTIASLTLDPANGKAWIHYYLSSRDQTLSKVDVVWGHPAHSKVNLAILQKSAKRFKNLFTQFRQLKTQTTDRPTNKEPFIFYGVDALGKGIKMLWAKPLNKNFQPISKSERTLTLSYFLP